VKSYLSPRLSLSGYDPSTIHYNNILSKPYNKHYAKNVPDKPGSVVQLTTEASPCNHCCCGKAIAITYSGCVSVALVIQHAVRMRRIVICGLSGLHHIFPDYLIKVTIFEKKTVLNIKYVDE